MPGPLTGVRVIEMASIGPIPLAGMLLADLGAEVVQIARAAAAPGEPPTWEVQARGQRRIVLNLKSPEAIETLLSMVERADVLIEGYRPGVMERLGLGPDDCAARNPRLVYGRLTGWGREGPYAQMAGHDLNYIAGAGALAHFGRAGVAPAPALNLVGDFGGGTMFLLLGVLSALHEAQQSGLGQVVDAAMVDGVAALMSAWWGYAHIGRFDETKRGEQYFDTGAHFFEVYECADGGYLSVAPIEDQFYAELLRLLGLTGRPEFEDDRRNPEKWPAAKAELSAIFRTRTRDEWMTIFDGTDACVAPVLRLSEAAAHPHHQARGTFVTLGGVKQPAPAPRFSRSTPDTPELPHAVGADTRAVLQDWGIGPERVTALLASGAAAQVADD